jgi:type IV secretion system protein VirB10
MAYDEFDDGDQSEYTGGQAEPEYGGGWADEQAKDAGAEGAGYAEEPSEPAEVAAEAGAEAGGSAEERAEAPLLDEQAPAGTFAPEPKRSFTEAAHPKKRAAAPAKTNKTLVLSAIAGAFALLVIASVAIPSLRRGKQPKESAETPVANDPRLTDYSLLVPEKEAPLYMEPSDAQEPPAALPPLSIDGAVQAEPMPAVEEPPAPRHAAPSQGAYASERPNTRGDRLQAKSISGIKGLTSTQSRYLDGSSGLTAQAAQAEQAANPYAQYGLPPKEQYIQQALGAYGLQAPQPGAAAAGYAQGGGYAGNGYAAQNDQSGKTLFYQNGRDNAGMGQYLPQASIWQGTIFEATLTSDINTDLPGEATAMIAKNVYSSLDGKYMLIPQNSRLFGTYNSSISYSQSRVQVGWHTLIRPDGYAISLGNMQATDARGAAGLPGIVNDHPFQYLKALGLISAFRVMGGELGASSAQLGANNTYVQNLAADTQNMINTFGAKIIDRALDVQPTIVIRAGTTINIVANQTLLLPPLDPYPATQSYHR